MTSQLTACQASQQDVSMTSRWTASTTGLAVRVGIDYSTGVLLSQYQRGRLGQIFFLCHSPELDICQTTLVRMYNVIKEFPAIGNKLPQASLNVSRNTH